MNENGKRNMNRQGTGRRRWKMNVIKLGIRYNVLNTHTLNKKKKHKLKSCYYLCYATHL